MTCWHKGVFAFDRSDFTALLQGTVRFRRGADRSAKANWQTGGKVIRRKVAKLSKAGDPFTDAAAPRPYHDCKKSFVDGLTNLLGMQK